MPTKKLQLIALLAGALSGCGEPLPSLPVSDDVFVPQVHAVPYRINYFSIDPTGQAYGGAGRTLFRIEDDGNRADPVYDFEHAIRAIHFNQDGTLFVATDNNHWDPAAPSRLFRSVDGHKTFQPVLTIDGGSILWWSIDHDSAGNLYVGEYGPDEVGFSKTVWKTTDNGDSWTPVFRAENRDKVHIHRVAVDPLNDDVWVTVGDGKNRGAFRSSDGGKNWQRVVDTQATALLFTDDSLYFGEDRKNDSGVVRLDRRNNKTSPSLMVAEHGNYGGSIYDMAVGASGTLYVPFMKYPDREHVASVWVGDGKDWRLLMHVKSQQGKGSGRETIAGPDRDGWIYFSGYKVRDRPYPAFANP